ncbi:MAG TPA: protein kinase [Sandaracinaceae bacterium LLY-WYZ-13_1]|nr:protein kinase [Sandaracinaceae bacterium LLY-WYZ-13_1]
MSAPIPFGNYELIERIAEGGMAEVWRARSRGVAGFEKTVVIKRVLPSLLERPRFAELLIREAKIAARLSHPNIVQIFDLGEVEGGYFIAMEYLRGRDLAAALSQRSLDEEATFGLSLRLWIAAEVAKALDYAHRAEGDDGKSMQIVHRDVSPQNVLLGFEGEVKVADFGIARADEPGLGRGEDPKILRGKYAYMSPEQARGEPLDRRSDLFSFGILLYELATRQRMFRGHTSSETLERVRAARLPDFREGLPLPALVPILERALEADRTQRYGSAGEIHGELTRLLYALGEPVGQTDLAAAMRVMFPPSERERPNKLRVDLLSRAYDDATAASDAGRPMAAEATVPATTRTRALPTSRRLRAESRRLAFFAIRPRPGDERLFDAAVEETGGAPVPASHGVLVGAYGVSGLERAVGHATRAALELRRTTRLEGPERIESSPPMVVLTGEGRVMEGVAVDAEPALFERAAEALSRTDPGDIRVDSALRPELVRDFRFRAEDDGLLVEGFRSRRDRDAGALRRRAPLVGRRGVLRELSGVLVDCARGAGALVHLVGEPGVGKSRVLAELRAAAAPKDFVFVHGRADEVDVDRSFGALGDLVQDLCGIEPEDAPAQRFEKVERLRVLGLMPREVRLVGELIGLAYPVPSGERVGRPRGIELALSIRRALRKLSEDRVVVLALEDLQWMDDATRQVLPLVVEGLIEARVLVLVTRRPGSVGPLPAGGRTVEIPPLGEAATGRLLAHWLGCHAVEPELAADVTRETGGIPAWVELVAEPLKARVQTEDGVARWGPDGAAPLALPDSVRSVVAARIERLRPRDRSMLRVAAALGGTVEVALLSAVEGLIGHTERPPLRRLLLRRLLASEDAAAAPPERLGAWGGDEEDERLPTRVRLPSELLRRSVLAELDDGECARLHGRIVATLERRGAGDDLRGLERLAHHAEASADARRAPEYLQRAGERARREGARERAARHFLRAAELLRAHRGDAADVESFELSLRAADEALAAGALELAEEALAPLGTAAGRVDPALAVRRALAEARRARRRLAPGDAIAALEAVEPHREAVPAALRAEVSLMLGGALLEHGATDRAVAVLEVAAREGAEIARGRALAAWAVALVRADRVQPAHEAVSEALALAAKLGAAELRSGSLAAMAAVLEARDDPAAAAARFREAAEVARDAGEDHALAPLHARAGVAALAAGDDAEAARRAADASRHAKAGRQEAWRSVASALQAALAIREHPEATWVPGIVRAVDRLEALGRSGEAALAVEMLAYAHLALDDPGAAARTIERAVGLAERAGDRNHVRRLEARRRGLGAP